MSVLVECYSVIVRRSAIEQRFPGGFDAYAAVLPRVFCADEHLTRVGFMASSDLRPFVRHVLSIAGLGGAAEGDHFWLRTAAAAIVEQHRGPWDPESAHWLEYAAGEQGVCRCWLKGTPPGKLATPPGWYPDPGMVKLDLQRLSHTHSEDAPRVRLYSARVFPESEDN